MFVCDVNFDKTDSFGYNLSDLAPGTNLFVTGGDFYINNGNHDLINKPALKIRNLFDCKTTKCGILNKPMSVPIFGWTQYNSGTIVGKSRSIMITNSGSTTLIK